MITHPHWLKTRHKLKKNQFRINPSFSVITKTFANFSTLKIKEQSLNSVRVSLIFILQKIFTVISVRNTHRDTTLTSSTLDDENRGKMETS